MLTNPIAIVFIYVENCSVPSGLAGYQAVRKIKDFLFARNHQIQNFIAIGNMDPLGQKLKQELEGRDY